MLSVCAALAVASAPAALPAAQASAAERGEAYYLFLHARKLEGEGDIDGAIAAHRRALALVPGSAEVHAELAGLFARQSRLADAIAEGQAALAIDPANREANRILGFAFGSAVEGEPGTVPPEALDQARKAVTHFEKARDGRAADPGAELTLGRLYLVLGDYDRAVVVLGDFLLDQPGYVDAILMMAEAQAGKGDAAAAARTLEQAVGAQPGNARAAMRLAELYEGQGRWLDAAGVYASLSEAVPRMTQALAPRRATALMNGGRLDEARALLGEITAANPNAAGVWYLASQAALRSGALADAERAARRIIALDAADPLGPSALADVLVARREFPRALETLQPWIDRSVAGALAVDVDELILPRAAQVYGELDRGDRAVEMLELLLKRTPANDDVKFELGAAYEQANRPADAEGMFRQVLQANPAHAPALNYLGYMLADRGERLEEAVSLVSRALEIEPGNPSYQDSLGWAYYKQGRYDLAADLLARAAASSATSSVVQDHYADALFALKRYAEAIATWERALAGDLSDVESADIQKKLARARALVR